MPKLNHGGRASRFGLVSWRLDSRQRSALVLLIGAILCLVASFVLSLEALMTARDPSTVLACDLSATVSCSGVAAHWSASLLGFPNHFIGMMAFPVVVTIAVSLLAGVRFPRWFMYAALAGVALAAIFAIWLLFMSVFAIGLLCPWCLALDVGLLLVVYGLVRYAVLAGVITGAYARRYVEAGFDTLALMSCYVAIAGLIIVAIASNG